MILASSHGNSEAGASVSSISDVSVVSTGGEDGFDRSGSCMGEMDQ